MRKTISFTFMLLVSSFVLGQKSGTFETITYLEKGEKIAPSVKTEGESTIKKEEGSKISREKGTWYLNDKQIDIEVIYYVNFDKDASNNYKLTFISDSLGIMNEYTGRFHDGPVVYTGSSNEEKITIEGKNYLLKFWVMDTLWRYDSSGKLITEKDGWRMNIDISEDGKEWSDWISTMYQVKK